MRLQIPKDPTPAPVQTFLDNLTQEEKQSIADNTYSTSLLRSLIDLGISACGCKMYAKMNTSWLDTDVASALSDRLNPDQSVKTYREYYIILAENETSCIVRLCPKDESGNIPKGMYCSIDDMMVLIEEIEPSSKFYNYEDALIEKDVILGI